MASAASAAGTVGARQVAFSPYSLSEGHVEEGQPDVWEAALESAGADPDAIMAMVDAGRILPTVQVEHTDNVRSHHVWGVPTIIAGDRAVFIRLLDRPEDTSASRARIERLVELITEFPELHEFKQTDLPV